MQKCYCNVAVGSTFTQDILARILLDRSFIGVLRQNLCHSKDASNYGQSNKDLCRKVSHKVAPALVRIAAKYSIQAQIAEV